VFDCKAAVILKLNVAFVLEIQQQGQIELTQLLQVPNDQVVDLVGIFHLEPHPYVSLITEPANDLKQILQSNSLSPVVEHKQPQFHSALIVDLHGLLNQFGVILDKRQYWLLQSARQTKCPPLL
jgi:hypothetical protein